MTINIMKGLHLRQKNFGIKLRWKSIILSSVLLWLHRDILTEVKAWHSDEPKQIFRDMKASRCSNQQMCATDASTGQDFGPYNDIQTAKNCTKNNNKHISIRSQIQLTTTSVINQRWLCLLIYTAIFQQVKKTRLYPSENEIRYDHLKHYQQTTVLYFAKVRHKCMGERHQLSARLISLVPRPC